MKAVVLTIFFAAQLTSRCIAGTSLLPEIPTPKLNAADVLGIFGRVTHNSTNLIVVGIDWYKSSDFQPRLGGPHCSPGNDHPDEYSWFVTYVYTDERTDKELRKLGIKRQYNTVGVFRIKDDGQSGLFIGVQ